MRTPARAVAIGLAVALLSGSSCGGPRATRAQCAAILERIVEIELAKAGYRDPALAERKRAELRGRFASDLDRCRGRRIPPGAIDCLAAAKTAEEVSHQCLH